MNISELEGQVRSIKDIIAVVYRQYSYLRRQYGDNEETL